MGKIRFICILVLLSELSIMLLRSRTTLDVDSNLQLSTQILETVDIEYISENSCYCDIGCLSTIVNLMLADGYELTDFSSTNDSIVCTVGNSDDSFKFIYQYVSRKLVVVGYDYSKSYIPLTYINDEMRLKK